MRAAWGACLAILVASATVAAAPQVEIKAQTQLALGKVRLRPDGTASIEGQLIDKLTGEGLGGQTVQIRVAEGTFVATTAPDGKFAAALPVAPGPQQVALEFTGGGALDASALTVTTDPARAPVTLAMTAEDASEGAHITVLATADDQPAKLSVALAIATPKSPALAPLGTVTTGTPFTLTRRAAGGTGLREVHATFPGDDTRQPASAELTVELTSATVTSLSVSDTKLAYEDDLEVHGTVTDLDHHGVPRAAVTLTSGDRRLAQGATADDGSYHLAIEAQILGAGQLGVQVQADPGGSLRASRSPPVIVDVASAQPVPVSYTVLAFLATALAAGGFFAARTKPWRKLRRARAARDGDEDDADGAPGRVDDLVAEGGVVMAKPGLISNLRRAHDDGVAGVVADTVRHRPIAGARVRLTLEAGADVFRELETADDGAFALEGLPAGNHRVEVLADGFVAESFVAALPHRGELRGVRIQLVPVRERVFQLYRRAAEPVLPEARLWGIWSPRQIVDHVRAKRPSPELAELTDFVEEVYFSSRVAAESVLPDASERVDRAIRERIRVPS